MLGRVLESRDAGQNLSGADSDRVAERTVQEVLATNPVRFFPDRNGRAVAHELVTTQAPGAPVVNDDDRLIGFISEIDVLRALRQGRNLSALTARELMNPDRLAVEETASITEALRLMEKHRLQVLPVVHGDRVVKSVLRSDVIRAWTALAEGR